MSSPESHKVVTALQTVPTLSVIVASVVAALSLAIGGCSKSPVTGTDVGSVSDLLAENLIKQFVAEPPPEGADRISPLYGKIVACGSNAVPTLIQALGNASPEYQEKRIDFIFILGQIGDSRAYDPLLAEFVKEKRLTARRRIAISLGASLSPKLATRFPEDILSNAPQDGPAILKELAEADLGSDSVKWREFLSNPNNLKAVIERCRTRSKPILG